MSSRPKVFAKLALLTTLYLSQGLPFGFFTQALPALLREQGYSLETIGLTSLVALPWALKFLWAPLIDRYSGGSLGPRRSWIIPLQILMVLLLLAVGRFSGGEAMDLLIAVVVLVNLLSATQDIATDALAIDMLEQPERGLANGVQVAGYRLGMIIGGGGLLILHQKLGWAGTFDAMAIIIAVASIPILFYREQRRVNSTGGVSERARMVDFFRQSGAWKIVALIMIYKAGDYFGKTMLKPYLIDSGLDIEDVGWLVGTVGFVAGMVGALVGGMLVNSLGRRRALVGFAGLQALSVAGYALMAGTEFNYDMAVILCGAEHLASGMATAALFTCMMDWSRPSAAATDYTVQASLVVLANGLASAASGFSAGALGYPIHFALAAIFALVTVALVAVLYPDSSKAIA